MKSERVFVGLGANLGDATRAVRRAIEALSKLPGTRLVAASSLYRSAPVDAAGPEYVNAVAELQSSLEPSELLLALQALEQESGRERPYRNAPRTLDLDLLLVGQQQLSTPELTLPHPRLHERAFVLRPLLELDPALVHPRLGPLGALLRCTASQPVKKL